jgi:hypothetical protein
LIISSFESLKPTKLFLAELIFTEKIMQLRAYLEEIKKLKFYIIPVFLLITGTYLFFNIVDKETGWHYCEEDGLVEWGTCIFYFLSSLFFLFTFRKTKNIYILLLSLVMFFGAGEEISWGQRIFGFKTPETVKKDNVQGEFNVHNLEIFNALDMNQKEKHGLAKLTDLNFLFKVFNLIFGIAVPLCIFHFNKISTFCRKMKIPVPPISLGIFFLLSWLGFKYSILHCLVNGVEVREPEAVMEIAELNSAFIMTMIALYFYNFTDRNTIIKDIKQVRLT